MKKIGFFLFISSLLISCNTSKNTTINHLWSDVAVIEEQEVYTDTATIEHKDGYTYAWVKNVYVNQKSKNDYVNKIRQSYQKQDAKLDTKMKKWDNFAYNISYRVFDCSNKRYRVLEVRDYTADGVKIITTKPHKDNVTWTGVGTETMGDYTLFHICDHGN